MVLIRFSDAATERRALGWLAGRFPFKTWATGELLLPAEALAHLAQEGIRFQVEGPPTYEQAVPALRDPVTPPVQ